MPNCLYCIRLRNFFICSPNFLYRIFDLEIFRQYKIWRKFYTWKNVAKSKMPYKKFGKNFILWKNFVVENAIWRTWRKFYIFEKFLSRNCDITWRNLYAWKKNFSWKMKIINLEVKEEKKLSSKNYPLVLRRTVLFNNNATASPFLAYWICMLTPMRTIGECRENRKYIRCIILPLNSYFFWFSGLLT